MNLQQIKQRFEVIGNAPLLNRALEVAIQVAPTDISVLVTGESGTGKEIIPQVIHNLSSRKHGEYIAVNCGAIPEEQLIPNCLDTKKGHLLEHMAVDKDILRLLTVGQSSWMKLLNYQCKHKFDCCVF